MRGLQVTLASLSDWETISLLLGIVGLCIAIGAFQIAFGITRRAKRRIPDVNNSRNATSCADGHGYSKYCTRCVAERAITFVNGTPDQTF